MSLKLIIGDTNELTSADIPVRWCIDNETLDKIENEGIENPQILIITCSDGIEMSRKLVPISDLMTYIRFERPGENKVFGFILRDLGKSLREIKAEFLRIDYGKYIKSLIYNGRYYDDDKWVLEYCKLSAHIPKELFGKEPPKWLNDFVNLWHDTKVNDQCHFRRRFLLSIPKAFIAFPISLILGFCSCLIYMLYWSIGFKDMSYLPIIHPLKNPNPISVITVAEYSTRFVLKTKNHDYEFGSSLLIPLVSIILPIIVSFFLDTIASDSPGFLTLWGIISTGVLGVSAIMIFIEFLIYKAIISNKNKGIMYKVDNYLDTKWVVISNIAFIAIIISPFTYVWNKYLKFLDTWDKKTSIKSFNNTKTLLCSKDPDNMVAEIYAIPKEQQTIKLKFMDFKTKVCKPMPK